VVTSDDNQGAGAAQFAAKDLNVKRCYVLNDNQTYGQGVATVFAAEARKQGIDIVGSDAWDAKQTDYSALFIKVKAANPDCVFLGGIVDQNGVQLVRDKVRILGDNTAVKLLAPDGFTGVFEFNRLKEAQGAYLHFPGVPVSDLRSQGGVPAGFLDTYKAKYGADPPSPYAVYAVQALQVILAAIANSDGTRKGVTAAVFGGSGITVPASTAMLGKDVAIDPKTGDVGLRQVSVEQVKDNDETYVKTITL
jgi:branched-chain amino acid transport system substrate-binding protein